jgi:hypothetical protein
MDSWLDLQPASVMLRKLEEHIAKTFSFFSTGGRQIRSVPGPLAWRGMEGLQEAGTSGAGRVYTD